MTHFVEATERAVYNSRLKNEKKDNLNTILQSIRKLVGTVLLGKYNKKDVLSKLRDIKNYLFQIQDLWKELKSKIYVIL
jgi:flagellin-specific chaperone FliS